MVLSNNSIKVVDLEQSKQTTEATYNTTEINNYGRELATPKKITGYYMKLIRMLFQDLKREDIELDVFFNENKIREKPVYVLIDRGAVSPSNLAIPGGTFQNIGDFVNIESNNGININSNETLSGTSLLTLQLTLKIYAHNRAEIEEVGYDLFKLLLSVSDNILGKMFTNIRRVMEPTMSQYMPVKDYDDMFVCEIDWSIVYVENNILLFKEKMLKYTNFIVFDEQAQDEIKIQKDK